MDSAARIGPGNTEILRSGQESIHLLVLTHRQYRFLNTRNGERSGHTFRWIANAVAFYVPLRFNTAIIGP